MNDVKRSTKMRNAHFSASFYMNYKIGDNKREMDSFKRMMIDLF